jgi:hypothetical protein
MKYGEVERVIIDLRPRHHFRGDLAHPNAVAKAHFQIAEGVAVTLVDLGFCPLMIGEPVAGKGEDVGAYVCPAFINSSIARPMTYAKASAM